MANTGLDLLQGSEPTFDPGALVSARGRNWVVLPPDLDAAGVVRLRPVDGPDSEAVGVYRPLEPNAIKESQYEPPDPARAGDFAGALLLRDAVRLGLRSGAGPFRSMGRLSVTPRPYQFVPLIMALRQDPVRLLIADDVGVGKTIEAAMIARELLDRGAVRRIGVLCAPHLCEQWEEELRTKFDIRAAVVQSSRIGRLERGLPLQNISLYRHYRHLVVSIDFVKLERNRDPFLRDAPDLIIVDEAHTAARPRGARSQGRQQQRYALVRDLADQPGRHIILVTATPHSGVEESFRSLLGLLDRSLDVDGDEDGAGESKLRRSRLVPHLVQRKRSDLRRWLEVDTPFPERESAERTYQMSSDYQRLYNDILAYCREYVNTPEEAGQRRRVRYWAALSILRCALSSPGAARAVLENRKQSAAPTAAQNGDGPGDEELGRQILDSADEEHPADYVSTAALDDPAAGLDEADVRKLNAFLRRAKKLDGPERDAKIGAAAGAVSDLLAEGYHPIVYCRYIQTAYYAAEHLQQALEGAHPGLAVRAVTGNEGDSEQRREIVTNLAQEPVRVLVATDCLSEGVNLQDHYDAVVHYDLPWNPNRLEQREGRVDRFGQSRKVIKTVLLYGSDNEMDLAVLKVLLEKAQTIRRRLGISVPVPVESEQVINTLIKSVLLRGDDRAQQFRLALEHESVSRLHDAWERMAEKEIKTRNYFAQRGIEPDDVARELEETEPVLGNAEDLKRFVANAVQRFNGELSATREAGVYRLNPGDLQERIAARDPAIRFPMRVSFEGVPRRGAIPLRRNHPAAAALAEAVLAKALEGDDTRFARAGAIFTGSVDIRTVVLVLRLRYLIEDRSARQFAEEVTVGAFRRDADHPGRLVRVEEDGLRLLAEAEPTVNMAPAEREEHVRWALDILKPNGSGWADGIVGERKAALEDAHRRLRRAVDGGGAASVEPHPPDIIGCYVLVPAGG